MKVYGHPWSINTRKTLMVFAEKAHDVELVTLLLPKGEHLSPEHLARHPFGKVPVLEDGDFVLYESRAINAYLDRTLPGPSLAPHDPRAFARAEQWMNVADAYFIPHAHPLLVETLFRRYLGGAPDETLIAQSRKQMQPALDQAEAWLASRPYFAGEVFSRADIHWLPYVEYLVRTGQAGLVFAERASLERWWTRASERPSWQRVARSGPQPYDPT